jgi:uncharacterized membrane protein YkvA (DUF1232 family)
MKDKENRTLDMPKQANEGFFRELFNNIKLIVRLLKDERVNFWLKLLPIGALIYLVVPVDLLSINPLDDAVVVWLGGYLFIELCPEDIVNEHREAIRKAIAEEHADEEPQKEVIDAEFDDLPPEDDE